MVTPISKTKNELMQLSDDELHKYFNRFTVYMGRGWTNARYAIRVGSIHIFSDDTLDLKMKFFRHLERELK